MMMMPGKEHGTAVMNFCFYNFHSLFFFLNILNILVVFSLEGVSGFCVAGRVVYVWVKVHFNDYICMYGILAFLYEGIRNEDRE